MNISFPDVSQRPRIVPDTELALLHTCWITLKIVQIPNMSIHTMSYKHSKNIKLESGFILKWSSPQPSHSLAQINRYYIQKQTDDTYKNKIKHCTQESLRYWTLKLAKKLAKNKNVTGTTKIFNKWTLALFLHDPIPKEL